MLQDLGNVVMGATVGPQPPPPSRPSIIRRCAGWLQTPRGMVTSFVLGVVISLPGNISSCWSFLHKSWDHCVSWFHPTELEDSHRRVAESSLSPAAAAKACDTLAGDPDDIDRIRQGLPTVEDGDIRDPEKVVAICRNALQGATGETEARLNHELARALKKMGKLTERDEKEQLSANANYPCAITDQAYLLYIGKDYKGAYSKFASVKDKSRSAMYWTGKLAFDGVPGVRTDQREGIALIRRAASLGDPEALIHRCVVSACEPD